MAEDAPEHWGVERLPFNFQRVRLDSPKWTTKRIGTYSPIALSDFFCGII